jgi:sulfur carrier protein
MADSTIRVNGRNEALAFGTIAELLASKGVESHGRGIAVAVNGQVVPRGSWSDTTLGPGDSVEIVHAMKGG